MAAFRLGTSPITPKRLRNLRMALDDPDADVRDQAAASLAVARDLQSIPRLIDLLDTTPPRYGRSIAWGLSRLVAESEPDLSSRIVASLERYRARARGDTRVHALELLRRLDADRVRTSQ